MELSDHVRGSLLISLKSAGKRVEERAPALLTAGRGDEPVEEGAVLGEDEQGAPAVGLQLDCRQRDRDSRLVQQHLVRVDDALVCDDVPVNRAVGVNGAALGPAPLDLAAADAEVEFEWTGYPLSRFGEPASFG